MSDATGYELNPAGRLFLFLEHLNTHGSVNENSLPTVASYFGLPPHYSVRLFVALASLLEQPDLMRVQVNSLTDPPLSHEDLLQDLPEVETTLQTLTSNLGVSLGQIRNQYRETTLRGLRTTSQILNRAGVFTASVPEENLTQVKRLAEALIDVVTNDDAMDAELRRVLYFHANAVRDAVDRYRVGGIDEVLSEFDKLMGLLSRRPDIVDKTIKTPKVRPLLGGLLLAFNLIAGMGNAAIAIEGGVERWIELTESSTLEIAPPEDPTENDSSV